MNCKQPILVLYFEFENELKFYNLGAWLTCLLSVENGSIIDSSLCSEITNMYILFQLGLIIAQHRDKRNHLSGIKTSALRYGLRRVYKIAKEKKGMQSCIITRNIY